MNLRFLFTRRSPEDRFWRWFLANFNRLQRSPSGPAELGLAIDRYHPKLKCDIWLEEDDRGRPTRFIQFGTYHGENVSAVQRLVAAAPTVPGWRIQAFQPRLTLKPVTIGEVTLDPEDVYFSVIEDEPGTKLSVRFYVAGLDRNDPHSAQGEATFSMIHDLLGEHDALTKLGKLDFRPLAEIDGNQRPLRDLQPLVDGRP